MENFYFLFEDLNDWDIWNEKGYTTGFIILIAISLLITAIYYLLLGRTSMSYSTLGKWFLFGILNSIFVFLTTLLIQGFAIFDYLFADFPYSIWIFSLINAMYAFMLYLLLSVVFKRFSIFSKFIPVKF